MAGASPRAASESVEVAVHNEGSSVADVQAVVQDDGVVVHSMAIDRGETGTLSAPTGTPVEVHSPGGTATAMAARGAFFVVRDDRVLFSGE